MGFIAVLSFVLVLCEGACGALGSGLSGSPRQSLLAGLGALVRQPPCGACSVLLAAALCLLRRLNAAEGAVALAAFLQLGCTLLGRRSCSTSMHSLAALLNTPALAKSVGPFLVGEQLVRQLVDGDLSGGYVVRQVIGHGLAQG